MNAAKYVRKWIGILLVSFIVVMPSAAFDFNMPASQSTDISMLENALAQSNDLLQLSQTLVTRTENIDPNQVNSEYIQAMLRLSMDIGVMANRIGEMANRIVYTEELVGVMADRIVTVSQSLLSNNQSTQSNLLMAEQNLNTILMGQSMR
jgi:hypothetical protein